MAETILIRVSTRTLTALERGGSVPIRLDRKDVVGGVVQRSGRRAGQEPWRRIGGLPRGGLGPRVAAGLLRRERWGRYVVTAKEKTARKVGLYGAGTNRTRVLGPTRQAVGGGG